MQIALLINNMKKILLILLISFNATLLFAGDGDRRLCLGGGWQTNIINFNDNLKIADVSLGYEFEGRYHKAWELNLDLATAYVVCPIDKVVCTKSFFDYRSFGIGIAYKPEISKGKNSLLRWKIGANIGANEDGFQAGIVGGLEYSYCFKNRLQLFAFQKNDFVFLSRDNFRNGLIVGLKLPLNK